MRRVVEPNGSHFWSRPVILAVVSVAMAGCSSEATRFSENPFATQRTAAMATPSEATGSVAPRPPARAVETQALPPPNVVAAPAQTLPSPPAASRVSATGAVPSRPALGDITGSTMPRQAGLAPTGRAPAPTAPTQQMVHTVAPGETLMKLSRQYGKPLTEIARANNIAPGTQVKIGDRIVIPGARTALRMPQAAPPIAAPQMQATTGTTPKFVQGPQPAAVAAQQKVAVATPGQPMATARAIAPLDTPAAEPEKPTATAAAGSMPGFRWPVRGRVIAGFGPKTSGAQNDGVNIAVPEGTPIKAAEDGVVAYAGSELKSYGNLVLIRHSNGYVTAYAHASEISVKRDEPIKRGQVIGKAGQTGNVSTPQVHFEVRKGSAPIDPMPMLEKGGG